MKKNIELKDYIRTTLNQEFDSRKLKRSSYSLRTFAKNLDVDPTFLLKVLNGERSFGRLSLSRISKKIQNETFKEVVKKYLMPRKDPGELIILSQSPFEKWYEFPLWEVARVLKEKNKIISVGLKLGLTHKEIEDFLIKMIQFKLLDVKNKKEFIPNHTYVVISKETLNPNLLNIHNAFMKLAQESTVKYIPSQRSSSGLTCLMATKDIPVIKREIKLFRRKIAKFSDKIKKYDSIYQMQISLFPLSFFND